MLLSSITNLALPKWVLVCTMALEAWRVLEGVKSWKPGGCSDPDQFCTSLKAWRVLDDLAHGGNLPAALWVAEGLQTGEMGRVNETEAVEVLRPFILKSQWSVDLSAMMKSTEVFDRHMVISIAKTLL